MKLRTHLLAASLSLLLLAAAAGTASAVAKPGFPAGSWSGAGSLAGTTETAGDLTVRSSGTLKFTLRVSQDGKVGGFGKWRVTQIGSGSVGSKIVGVSNVTFSGTPIDVRYKGTQVITTRFVDPVHSTGNTFTREEPINGRLVIKKAGSCLVTGGHKAEGGTFKWKASLQGVTCRT
jgi:hypothetical protein